MHEEFGQRYWEEHYSGTKNGHRPLPHPHVTEIDLPPGRALDAGCGEGADARWLAERGWQVTAVDISATALDRARSAPGGEGVTWILADLTEWTPEPESFDLVCSSYAHPAGSFTDLLRRLAAAVAPGGTLLVAGHQPASHPHPGAHLTVEQATSALDPSHWDIAAEERTRAVPGPNAHGTVLHDTILRARRRP